MNKAAFLSLILHLNKYFTSEKVEEYVNSLEELKQKGDPEFIARNLEAQNSAEYNYDPEFKQKLEDPDFLMQKHQEVIDRAIQNLRWVGELTAKLNGKGVEEGTEIIRHHFSEAYKNAYKAHLMSEEDQARALRQDAHIYYFLAPGVVGGPAFDDHAIYRFFDEMDREIKTNCHKAAAHDLIPGLDECKYGMGTADLGLDHTVTTFAAINGDKTRLEEIQNDENEFPHNKQLARSLQEAETLQIQISIPGTLSYEVDKKAEGITKRFFRQLDAMQIPGSPKTSVLLKALESYRGIHLDNPASFQDITGDVQLFERFGKMAAEIRKNSSSAARDFHKTELFLQSVEAYSETMYHLCLEQGGAADRHEVSIQKSRQSISALFERLEKTAGGKRSPEFSRMYEALEKLNARTACNRRELAEQIEAARDAAKDYMEAKDGELLHSAGSRFTDQGQARYDAASGIYSLLDAMIVSVVKAAKEDNKSFIEARRSMIVVAKNDKSADAQKGDKVPKGYQGDFRLSKEYYLHEAKKALLQNERLSSLVERGAESNGILMESGVRIRSYINYMDLATSGKRRLEMPYDQFERWNASCHLIQSNSAKHTWKYAFIIGQNDDEALRDGSFVKKDIGFVPNAKQIQSIYAAASGQRRILHKIANLSLADAQKLRRSEGEMERAAYKFAAELDLPEESTERLAREVLKERKEQLEKRINDLTAVKDSPQKVNTNVIG